MAAESEPPSVSPTDAARPRVCGQAGILRAREGGGRANMFSSTAKSSRVEQLRAELAAKQQEARRLDNRYRQVALCAEPVTVARPIAELAAEPDQRRRFNAAFVRSLIDRDRPTDVHAVIQDRSYLLDEDVHQGRNPQAYARWLGNRTEVLRVLDELAREAQSKE